MELQILQKQLDESSPCPLCHASMYWIEAEQYTHELQFHECSHCQHRVFKQDSNLNCHCASCTAQRKKQTQQTRLQEQRKNKVKTIFHFIRGLEWNTQTQVFIKPVS